jgi:hypothetical protein
LSRILVLMKNKVGHTTSWYDTGISWGELKELKTGGACTSLGSWPYGIQFKWLANLTQTDIEDTQNVFISSRFKKECYPYIPVPLCVMIQFKRFQGGVCTSNPSFDIFRTVNHDSTAKTMNTNRPTFDSCQGRSFLQSVSYQICIRSSYSEVMRPKSEAGHLTPNLMTALTLPYIQNKPTSLWRLVRTCGTLERCAMQKLLLSKLVSRTNKPMGIKA